MDSAYRFEFRPYRRPFRQPLHTHHGIWQVREGVILRLTDADGRVGWGEIAPIEFFGTESVDQALHLCQALPSYITPNIITQIPSSHPATQFGFEAAWEMLHSSESTPVDVQSNLTSLPYSRLLPSGDAALHAWERGWQTGDRTFKWKIGLAPLAQELNLFEQLIQALPSEARLRLDANGGLTWEQACQWLQCCDALRSQDLQSQNLATVEFVEQPLPPTQFHALLNLSHQFHTPIALDESVTTLDHLKSCYEKGWRGVVVIKAAIAGSLMQLRKFCQTYPVDVVWSSVFETSIARQFIEQHLIPSVPFTGRAIGFGINHWFAESHFDQPDFEHLWQSL